MHTILASALDALTLSSRDRDAVAAWVAPLDGAAPAGTMARWMAAHDGERVHTVQIPRDGNARRLWDAGARRVDTTTERGAVYFHTSDEAGAWSVRHYRGMRVLATTADALMVCDDSTVIVYRATPQI